MDWLTGSGVMTGWGSGPAQGGAAATDPAAADGKTGDPAAQAERVTDGASSAEGRDGGRRTTVEGPW